MKRTRVDDLHKEWMKNPKYRREYEALEEEFSLTAGPDRGPIPCGPHAAAGSPAHEDDAGSGGGMPSTRTLEKNAKATGSRLRISFEPN